MNRFVLLHHVVPPDHATLQTHWDLMLESNGLLQTWQLDRFPLAATSVSARPLADHRLDYLDFEGPVSRGRGSVRRFARGTYQRRDLSTNRFEIALKCSELTGTLEFSRPPSAPVWSVTWRADGHHIETGCPGMSQSG